MPELAEVEFFRKRWHSAGLGQRVRAVHVHPDKKVFRQTDATALAAALRGTTFTASSAAAKQMAFRFDDTAWLGIHLGMTGELRVEPPTFAPGRHDHLALRLDHATLVFSDPRMFGEIRHAPGPEEPTWWSRLAPPLLSRAFTVAALTDFLRRRARAPLKAVLLMQERFPGVGNWMADEILWRAALHPARPAGSLTAAEIATLWRETRRVCRLALRTIAGEGGELPPDLNIHIPDTWLFNHRWADGGRCPKTRRPLARAEIGGRTTCWSPARQKLPAPRSLCP